MRSEFDGRLQLKEEEAANEQKGIRSQYDEKIQALSNELLEAVKRTREETSKYESAEQQTSLLRMKLSQKETEIDEKQRDWLSQRSELETTNSIAQKDITPFFYNPTQNDEKNQKTL